MNIYLANIMILAGLLYLGCGLMAFMALHQNGDHSIPEMLSVALLWPFAIVFLAVKYLDRAADINYNPDLLRKDK